MIIIYYTRTFDKCRFAAFCLCAFYFPQAFYMCFLPPRACIIAVGARRRIILNSDGLGTSFCFFFFMILFTIVRSSLFVHVTRRTNTL